MPSFIKVLKEDAINKLGIMQCCAAAVDTLRHEYDISNTKEMDYIIEKLETGYKIYIQIVNRKISDQEICNRFEKALKLGHMYCELKVSKINIETYDNLMQYMIHVSDICQDSVKNLTEPYSTISIVSVRKIEETESNFTIQIGMA